MTTLTADETLSGYLKNMGADYTLVHNAAAGFAFQNQVVTQVSNSYIVDIPEYQIYRGALKFDLSALPADAPINSAVISLYIDTLIAEDGAFNLIIVSGADLADPLVDGDYGDLLNETTSFGSISSSSIVLNTYNNITLNSTGIAAITKGAINYFGARLSGDIDSTTPLGDSTVQWLGYGYGNDSYITITYGFIPKIFYY